MSSAGFSPSVSQKEHPAIAYTQTSRLLTESPHHCVYLCWTETKSAIKKLTVTRSRNTRIAPVHPQETVLWGTVRGIKLAKMARVAFQT